MSRYKVVKSQDRKYELKKKRDRIQSSICVIWFFLIIIGLIICGFNQNNDSIMGVSFIVMGIISVPTAIFYIYADLKGWKPIFWYDNPEIAVYASKEQKEKDISGFLFSRVLLTIFLVLFSIGFIVLGVLKILGEI